MANRYLAPFPRARISGYDFGTHVPPGGWTGTGSDFGWPIHLGTDFGTAAGEAIVASAPATTKFETGLPGYGNRLTETFDNGWSLVFGHVAAGGTGRVVPGQQIGVTGHDVGSSVGSVTLVELHTPSGEAVNPDAFIQSTDLSSAVDLASHVGQANESFSQPGSLVDFSGPGGIHLNVGNPLGDFGQGFAQGLNQVSNSIASIPTNIGHGLADFFVTSEANVAEWLKRQSVAFFVAAVVLLVLFL